MPASNDSSISSPSERKAHAAVLASFGTLFPEGRALTNVILATGAERGPQTSEYDIIFVCRAGIIVFEVKGWANGILRSRKDDSGTGTHDWWIERPDGAVVPVRDPVAQGGFKVRYLLDELPGVHTTQYTVLSEESLELDPTVNAHVVRLVDLSYLARVTKATAKKFHGQSLLDERTVNAIADSLVELSLQHTPQAHLRSISEWVVTKEERTQSSSISHT